MVINGNGNANGNGNGANGNGNMYLLLLFVFRFTAEQFDHYIENMVVVHDEEKQGAAIDYRAYDEDFCQEKAYTKAHNLAKSWLKDKILFFADKQDTQAQAQAPAGGA